LNFNEIYNQQSKKVYNFCLNYLQNIEDAEEVTQDVFVKVYTKIEGFNNQSQLSTWIYRIAINTCIDFVKMKSRKKRLGFLTSLFYDNTNEVKHDFQSFLHPGVELEQKEAVAAIFKEINKLPINQKTALILSKIEHKSGKEIALIMNVTEKAVESLLQRAKTNLSKKLNTSE
jgi:RNA polymerase sigma-70 factor (ECF subfamily)